MENKELVINKKTDLLNIKNKNSYTKLTLNCEVNPILLKGFNNIKELTIQSDITVDNHLNEMTLNKLPFINTLEKLNFINIDQFGKKDKKKRKSYFDGYNYYQHNFPNLKYINFTSDSHNIYITDNYFNKSPKLEVIETNILGTFRINGYLPIPSTLKNIIINIFDDKYIIDLDYIPNAITRLNFDVDDKVCYLEYKNDIVKTDIDINIITDEIKKTNKLTKITDKLIKENTLYIPDYITNVEFYNKDYRNKIEHISFNINLLKNITYKTYITDNNYLNIIKTIELRNNNEMSLYPSTIININDYGIINNLYIIDNKLHVVFETLELIVNEDGIINQIEKKEEKEEEKENDKETNTINLDNYSISELENYLQYRKLLETFKDYNDTELNKAINLIGEKVIKKLTK